MRAVRKVQEWSVAAVAESFRLEGYWFGTRWCPAVVRTPDGQWRVRVVVREETSSSATTGRSRSVTYGYFELAADGTVLHAPRGFASVYKPGRITGLEEAVEDFREPRPDAPRLAL